MSISGYRVAGSLQNWTGYADLDEPVYRPRRIGTVVRKIDGKLYNVAVYESLEQAMTRETGVREPLTATVR